MFRTLFGILLLYLATKVSIAQNSEPSLETIFQDLELTITKKDGIKTDPYFQGLFLQNSSTIEVLLVAKYSFGKQPIVSNIRAGYYLMTKPDRRFSLFECGPEAGDQSRIHGLPADPRGPYRFPAPKVPFGFYIQSATFNPQFTITGETIFTEDRWNRRIGRFGQNIHKVWIFPYRTRFGIKPNWFVLCWEVSTDHNYQDLITVVRGVKIVPPPPPKKTIRENRFLNPLITFFLSDRREFHL